MEEKTNIFSITIFVIQHHLVCLKDLRHSGKPS